MESQRQRERLQAAVEAVLDRRNLTVNAASQRFGFDRNTLTKFANGNPVGLEWVERFAGVFGLDVNEWRELAGYPPVQVEPTGAAIYQEGLKFLSAEFGRPLAVNHHDEEMSPHEAFRQLLSLHDQLRRGVI